MKKTMLSMFMFFLLLAIPAWSADIVSVTSGLVNLLRQRQLVSTAHRPFPYRSIIQKTGKIFRVDPRLILSVIKHESDFNPHAVSVKGAKGLMQLMPETAALVGVKNSFDPAQNIYGGTKYLQQMIQRFNGDIYAALLAYNAGPTRVSAGDIPAESHRYASSVLSLYRRLRSQL